MSSPPTHNCKEKPAALRLLDCSSHTQVGRKNDLDAANSSSHHPARRVREHSSTAPAKSQARDDGDTRKGVVAPSVPTSMHARAPRLPQGRRSPARSRAGAASLQSPYVFQLCLLSVTCQPLGRPARERRPLGHLQSSPLSRERAESLPFPWSRVGAASFPSLWSRVERRPPGHLQSSPWSRLGAESPRSPAVSPLVTGGRTVRARAVRPPRHRAAGLSRGARLSHSLPRGSPHEIVPEFLAPDIVGRFAHQRPSHGPAFGGEAATHTDDTGVDPAVALGVLTLRPPHDTRGRLTATRRFANQNALR